MADGIYLHSVFVEFAPGQGHIAWVALLDDQVQHGMLEQEVANAKACVLQIAFDRKVGCYLIRFALEQSLHNLLNLLLTILNEIHK